MKKLILWIQLAWLMAAASQAQIAQEGNYPFVKNIKAYAYGIQLEVDAPAKMVCEVLEKRFEKATKKKSSKLKKKVMEVKAAVLSPVSTAILDYYYRVEPLGKDRAQVTLFLSAGNYNFLDRERYASEIAAAKSWLNELPAELETYKRQQAIEAQLATIKELEKEEAKLAKTEKKLARVKTRSVDELEELEASSRSLQQQQQQTRGMLSTLQSRADSARQQAGAALSSADSSLRLDMLARDTTAIDSTSKQGSLAPQQDEQLQQQLLQEQKRLRKEQAKLEKQMQKIEKQQQKLQQQQAAAEAEMRKKQLELEQLRIRLETEKAKLNVLKEASRGKR
ncbi:MAG: hypothetical protein D6730_07030 [Bacteroidetes bacterium]|nr:MAG: hypothetical protein D6730_07030 [Bacteroidota bacterium]